MSNIKTLDVASMKRGEFLARLDKEIQRCAKDISERPDVDGKREIICKLVMEEESGIVQIRFSTSHKLPAAPDTMAVGYIKDGKLVSQGDADDIMRQPKLTKIEGSKKTGTEG